MMNKLEMKRSLSANPPEDPPPSKPFNRHRFLKQVAGAFAILALCAGPIHAQDNRPDDVRRYIAAAVGGIDKLSVPPTDADIPVPAPVPIRIELLRVGPITIKP